MRTEFRYGLERGTRTATMAIVTVLCLATTCSLIWLDGMYMFACTTVITLSALGIAVLSRPRRIIFTDESISVRSISAMHSILRREITGIEHGCTLKHEIIIPLCSSLGLFGIYGTHFSLRHFQRTYIFASRSKDLTRITTSDGSVFLIGFPNDAEAINHFTNETLH